MAYKFLRLFFLISVVCFVGIGCGLLRPRAVIPPHNKAGTRLIAVLLVNNKAGDEKAAQALRNKVLYALYFKGYPKISFDVIDEKLSKAYPENIDSKREDISSQAVGKLLNIDAVMYCTLKECRTSFSYFRASTVISADFELKNAKTGETLWRAQQRTVKRSFGFSRKDLEMESAQVYEPAIQEIINKALKTLPDGPDSPG
ncbi:MAG: DUF799 family lipoprotein [Syntrophales bacterium]|nr:DUF799 family lipoprotein [Syntrophales bacterium]